VAFTRAGALLLALALLGCSSNVTLNSAFRIEPKDVDKATERGVSLLKSGGDPYSVYKWSTKSVNERVSQQIIVQDAALCLPKDEIAFAIVKQGDPSDSAVKRAVSQAVKRASNEVKFSVVLQITTGRDPKTVEFEMRTNTGGVYPPLAVEEPVMLRTVSSVLDPTAPPSALWGYDVHFPLRGSPGYPPIDTSVNTLYLVVRDGQSESRIPFDLTGAMNRRYGGTL
jgi:hypothetical protein